MINIVVAMDQNWAIGNDNKLLCHLPNDLKNFQDITSGDTVVMGRKTYESLPTKPLPNRHNVILSSTMEEMSTDNLTVVNDIDDLFDMNMAESVDSEWFIIGGSEIYRQFLPYADRIYLTKIKHSFEESDTFFPRTNFLRDWKIVSFKQNIKDRKNKYNHDFVVYDRKI